MAKKSDKELQVRVHPTPDDKYVALILVDEVFYAVGAPDEDIDKAIINGIAAAKPVMAKYKKKKD